MIEPSEALTPPARPQPSPVPNPESKAKPFFSGIVDLSKLDRAKAAEILNLIINGNGGKEETVSFINPYGKKVSFEVSGNGIKTLADLKGYQSQIEAVLQQGLVGEKTDNAVSSLSNWPFKMAQLEGRTPADKLKEQFHKRLDLAKQAVTEEVKEAGKEQRLTESQAQALKTLNLIVNGNGGKEQTVAHINADGKRVSFEVSGNGIKNINDFKGYRKEIEEIVKVLPEALPAARSVRDLAEKARLLDGTVNDRNRQDFKTQLGAAKEALKASAGSQVADNKQEGVKERYTVEEYAMLSQSMKDQIAMDYMDKALNGGVFKHPVTGEALTQASPPAEHSKKEIKAMIAALADLGVSDQSNYMMQAMQKVAKQEVPGCIPMLKGMVKACHEADKNFKDSENKVDKLYVNPQVDGGVHIHGSPLGIGNGVTVKTDGTTQRTTGAKC